MMIRKQLCALAFLAAFWVAPALLLAQIEEAESKLQEIYIDGNREKLLGNYDKAIGLFQEVLQKDPDNDAAVYEMARVLFAQNKDQEAIRYASRAMEMNPANKWYALFLADLYQKNNMDSQAASIYENLSKKYPNLFDYQLKWAFFTVKSGQPEKAIKIYDELEKRMGVNEEIARRKHSLYMGMGDNKKATRELEKLTRAFPTILEYRYLLAAFFEQSGDKKSAENVYREILKIKPDEAQAKLLLAGTTKSQASPVQFLKSLKPVMEDRNVSLDTKIKELIPFVQQIAEKPNAEISEELLSLTKILKSAHPAQAKVMAITGDVLLHSGQIIAATEQYKNTAELDPSVFSVWEQLLYCYKSVQDYQNLLDYSEKALDYFPNQYVLYQLNGLAWAAKGKHSEAVNSLQQALIMTTKNPMARAEILTQLGGSFCAQKKYERAEQSFVEAISLNNGNTESVIGLARCLSEQTKRLPDAKDQMADLLKSNADNHVANELMGDILFQLGDTEMALGYWKKALDKLGTSPTLERKIAEKQLK